MDRKGQSGSVRVGRKSTIHLAKPAASPVKLTQFVDCRTAPFIFSLQLSDRPHGRPLHRHPIRVKSQVLLFSLRSFAPLSAAFRIGSRWAISPKSKNQAHGADTER